MAYKDLWRVERAFRELESGLDLRPIYHWSESQVRGHIMVCFLAFGLETALRKRLVESGCEVPYHHIIEDLKQLKAVKIELEGQSYVVRTDLAGKAFDAFKAVGPRPPAKVEVVSSN